MVDCEADDVFEQGVRICVHNVSLLRKSHYKLSGYKSRLCERVSAKLCVLLSVSVGQQSSRVN